MQLDFVDADIGNYALADAEVYELLRSDSNKKPPLPSMLLSTVVASARTKLNPTFLAIDPSKQIVREYSRDPAGDENSNLAQLLLWCWRHGTFEKIRRLKMLQLVPMRADLGSNVRVDVVNKLDVAYNKPFVGDAAEDFIAFLYMTDDSIRKRLPVYAKAIPVVQSSGMGKSRMLTEIGSRLFTLPICLRDPDSIGYPACDENVYEYFARIPKDNEMSFTGHFIIANFLAAAYQTMLKWLKNQQSHHKDGGKLHDWWYKIMEQQKGRPVRREFFAEVIEEANSMNEKRYRSARRSKVIYKSDSQLLQAKSKEFYAVVKQAVGELMAFMTGIYGEQPLCVTYFDEAHELGTCYWILMRLLSHQDMQKKMWYVFMGTKSSILLFAPASENLISLRLRKGLSKLLSPYIALDFDQNVLETPAETTVTVGELQSFKHLARYGRPLWVALLEETPHAHDIINEIIETASTKLMYRLAFDEKNIDHVFAVLSQRLCLEPVLVSSEAIALADRSVAHHMRLVTGISADRRTFHTYSPSEPVLVLAAVRILYDTEDGKLLGRVLDTFTNHLCSSGLVEKGLMGELGARLLLLLARDFAAPKESGYIPNLFKPVPLLDVMGLLFDGNNAWKGTHKQNKKLIKAFKTAYVNFTHWIVTADHLPEEPDQMLLANLWARGAILQCCFNQGSIDFLMVVYFGNIATEAVFDPAKLSAVYGQVKFKNKTEAAVEKAIRPIGLPRDLSQPLPYLTLLLELGNESSYQGTHSKIKVTVPADDPVEGKFRTLRTDWLAAAEALEDYQREHPKMTTRNDSSLDQLEKAMKQSRQAMDAYNRHSIAVRGASGDVYGILRKANIQTEFATFLSITMPSPTAQDKTLQHMRPLERLGNESDHNAWMFNYVRVGKGDEPMDVDG